MANKGADPRREEDHPVPKKKQRGGDEAPAVQVVFRLPQNLHDALQAAAAGLGLDLSNLLRMMIAEHVPEYVERGRRAASALEQLGLQARQVSPAAEQGPAAKAPAPEGRRKRTIEIEPDQT
jgi:hypothetical protein